MPSINDRLIQDVKQQEIHMWRAMRDNGPALFEFMSDDCAMAISNSIFDEDTSPTTRQYLETQFRPWTKYDMHELKVIPVGMMAASVICKLTASREETPGKLKTLSGAVVDAG